MLDLGLRAHVHVRGRLVQDQDAWVGGDTGGETGAPVPVEPAPVEPAPPADTGGTGGGTDSDTGGDDGGGGGGTGGGVGVP